MEENASSTKNEEWKAKMKLIKARKKEEKALLKQEEARKRLVAPKDSKVVLIDKATLDKLSRKYADNSKDERKPVAFNLGDFPELGVKSSEKGEIGKSSLGKRGSWSRIIADKKSKDPERAFPSLESTLAKNEKAVARARPAQPEVEKTEHSDNIPQKQDADIPEKPVVSISALQRSYNTKNKKRKNPIVIDLSEICNSRLSENKKTSRKINKRAILGSKYRKHSERELLSGNMLDSSNPKRSRGKHREIKKKKLSNLKLTIIKERIWKDKVRNEAVGFSIKDSNPEITEGIDYKTEIPVYLENLKATMEVRKERIKQKREKSMVDVKEDKIEIVDNSKASSVSGSTNVAKDARFSNKFRNYCENVLTTPLNNSVEQFIQSVCYLQDKAFYRDPIKARAKRRYVTGFREVKKALRHEKVKMIIMAPDLENLQAKGSLNDMIGDIKTTSAAENIPVVFALNRRRIGILMKKVVPGSVVAVLNYEGLEDRFAKVLECLKDAQEEFQTRFRTTDEEKVVVKAEEVVIPSPNSTDPEDVTSKIISSLMSALRSETVPDVDPAEELNPFLRSISLRN